MWISECPSIIAHLFILPLTELLHFYLTHSHTILPINWLLGNMVLWMECIFVSVCSGLETLRAKKHPRCRLLSSDCTDQFKPLLSNWSEFTLTLVPHSFFTCVYAVVMIVLLLWIITEFLKPVIWVCILRVRALVAIDLLLFLGRIMRTWNSCGGSKWTLRFLGTPHPMNSTSFLTSTIIWLHWVTGFETRHGTNTLGHLSSTLLHLQNSISFLQ